jgi:SurA N-terminal domain.
MMKKNILMLAFVSTLLFPATVAKKPVTISTPKKAPIVDKVPDSAFDLDGIAAIVFSPAGTEVVTKRATQCSSLTGAPRTLDDIIFEILAYLDGQKYRIMSDDEAVDRYLSSIQRENNLTLDQLKQIFSEAGYSYEEGREQFKRLQTVNAVLDMKIRSNLIVPREAVQEYYDAHPEVQQASYYIQRGFVPFSSKTSKELQKQEILQFIQTGKGGKHIQWEKKPFWIDHDEVADDKSFIFTMQPDQISDPVALENGFEIFRLKERKEQRVASLEERFKDIVDILRKPKFEELMSTYKKHLFDTTSILYFN